MSAGFTEQEYQKLFDDLNDRIAKDPELRGNTFVINPDSVSSPADLNAVPNDLIAAHGGVSENSEQLLKYAVYDRVLKNREIATGQKIMGKELGLDDGSEIGIAIGVPRAETIEENFAFLARDNDADIDFSSKVSPEFSVKFVLYHELGHAVMTDKHEKAEARAEFKDAFNEESHAKYADNTMASYDATLEEMRGDSFATLMWIQEGGDIRDIETMISARNHAVGFRPDASEISKDLTHDSAEAMQSILDNLQDIRSVEGFEDMSVSDLAELADEYAHEAMPDYESYVEMSAEQDVIRSLLQTSYTMDSNSEAIAQSQRQQPLTEDGARLAIRFNEAYEDLHGKPSPLVNDERYKDVLNDNVTEQTLESAMDAIDTGALAPDTDGMTYSGYIGQNPATVVFNEQDCCIESVTVEKSDVSHIKLELSDGGAYETMTYNPQDAEAKNDATFEKDVDATAQKTSVMPQQLGM